VVEVLVVGYGSELHRDDAAGRRVADTIECRNLEGVAVRSITQLLPELTEEIAAASGVIFVDARMGGGKVTSEPVVPTTTPTHSHIGSPGELLGLMERLELHRPPAFLVSIPAFDVSVGEGLTEGGIDAVQTAIVEVERLIGQAKPE
jgi:hydrogenase maturation protease